MRVCSPTSPGAPTLSRRRRGIARRRLGLDLVELPLWYDIDDAASLDRLVQETSGSNTAPWTRHAIAALGGRFVDDSPLEGTGF
jgi:hypothetical protein